MGRKNARAGTGEKKHEMFTGLFLLPKVFMAMVLQQMSSARDALLGAEMNGGAMTWSATEFRGQS